MENKKVLLPRLAIAALVSLTLGGASAGGLAAAPAASASGASLPFNDIAGSFAQDDIVSLYALGIVDGTGGGAYEPGKAVTRAEFAAMVVRLFGLEPVDAAIPAFQDVRQGAWYYGSVEAASQLGFVNGLSADEFQPGAIVTREQAAAILVRALRLSEEDAAAGDASSSYADADSIDAWASASVQTATSAGLIEGDNGRFRPQDALTRAETAVLLNRIAERADWSAQFKEEPVTGVQLGWQYEQTTSQYIDSVSRSVVNTIVPRVFFLESASDFSDATDTQLLQWASTAGKRVWGMFGNRSDRDVTHALLSDENNRKAVVDKAASLVQKYGLAGLNLDFENVAPDDRDGLTAFVSELAAALHPLSATLSVDVSSDQDDDWTEAFDYAAIGKSADYIVLMGYDEHWAADPVAGSVSSLPWLEQGLDKLLEVVPAAKTIVGLPLYTRDWTTSPQVASTELSLTDQQQLVASLDSVVRAWDGTLGQYIYTYTKDGATHSIWAEDGRSLTLKSLAAAARGTAGQAYWYVGAGTPDVWTSLRNALKFAAFDPEH